MNKKSIEVENGKVKEKTKKKTNAKSNVTTLLCNGNSCETIKLIVAFVLKSNVVCKHRFRVQVL